MDIEIIPDERSTTESSSQFATNVKSNSSSKGHNSSSQSVNKNTLLNIHNHRRANSLTITSDVSTTDEIRTTKYTVFLLLLL
jgi:hypothetical protein